MGDMAYIFFCVERAQHTYTQRDKPRKSIEECINERACLTMPCILRCAAATACGGPFTTAICPPCIIECVGCFCVIFHALGVG